MTPYGEAFKGKKVLVTGGLGFIGSNLSAQLVSLGAHVTVVDNMMPRLGGNLFNVQEIAPVLWDKAVHQKHLSPQFY